MMMNALASAKSVNVRKLGYMTKISNPLHYHHFPFIKVPELWFTMVKQVLKVNASEAANGLLIF